MSWKVSGEGEHFLIRVLLPSGEHVEYELPHQPINRSVGEMTQFWWEYEGHVYSLAVPVSYPLEMVYPERFEDDEIRELIQQAKVRIRRPAPGFCGR